MTIDYWIFDAMNGLAGRLPWLDACCRLLAVFGLLFALLLVLAVFWWPAWTRAKRLRLLATVFIALCCCALLYLVEWWVVTNVLQFDLRARPSNIRWVTLLITESSRMAFPAWTVLTTAALAFALRPLAPRIAVMLSVLALFQGAALLVAGVNYPFDVLSGLILGASIGYSSGLCCLRPERATSPYRRWLPFWLLWTCCVIWFVIMYLTIRPYHATEDRIARNMFAADTFNVIPPDTLLPRLREVTQCSKITIECASNGSLTVAMILVILPEEEVSRARVHAVARETVNAAFTDWPELGLLTVDVSTELLQEQRRMVGTLSRATLARKQWPARGFHAGETLPGAVLYSPRYQALPAL